jgi:hypothetical protein
MTGCSRWLQAILPLAALAGCDGAESADNGSAPSTANSSAAPRAPAPVPAAGGLAASAPVPTLSCRAEVGAVAARRRADLCRSVSPATHPPCDAANSCAMIDDEVARGCAMIGDGADRPAGCGPAASSAGAAVDVVKLYYRAIAARDFAVAYAQWGDGGRASGKSHAAFAAGFAHTRTTRVIPGTPTDPEGAAGSSFISIPVSVEAVLDNGARQRFAGTYTLRRVNDVPGATADQLRWHIASARLRAVR